MAGRSWRRCRAVPPLGLLLLTLPALTAEPVKVAAGDVLNFCTARLPADAAEKADSLGWQRAPDSTIDKLRPLLEPPGDRMRDMQGWEGSSAPGSDIMVYAYDAPANDGSFMAMLKSVAPRGHACLYLAAADAGALAGAVTQRLGVDPSNDAASAAIGPVLTWETSSVIASLRDISPTQPPYTVALIVITK